MSSADREAALAAAVHQHISALADRLSTGHHDLTDTLFAEMSTRINDLPQDPLLLDLLRASVASNLENVVHYLRGHLAADEIPVPPAAAEYARRLAQRDSPPSALLRAYRLGQVAVLGWARQVTAELVTDVDVALAATHAFTDATFVYIDAVSEGVVTAYQHEREQWLANRSTVKRETVEALLSDERADVDAAEQAVGHRLRQQHLAVVLWYPDGSGTTAGLGALERTLAELGRALGAERTPLFIPRDRALAWGWLPLGGSAPTDVADRLRALAPSDDTRLAVGTAAGGLEGFRSSHHEALEAHRVALVSPVPDRWLTWYGDPGVRAAALLAVDLAATRRMVHRTLRGLADDSDSMARLRATLLAFLQERDSYVATASRMHLHKNTVRYRVERANQIRGRTLEQDRLDLELALHACAWLGREVLRHES